MTWLTPLAGLWLALAVIPPLILLYFLKLRRRPQPISCTILWKKAVEDMQANAPFQKLRRNILLLLQLLALLLLIAAVMQPQIRGGTGGGGRTVIFIDNSGSMTANDVENIPSRLDEAKKQARERIETMFAGGIFSKPPGEIMILGFSDRAEVYSRFSTSKRQLLDAIDQIPPTHGNSSIEQAFSLARAYTVNPNPDSDRPIAAPATFELFSDGKIYDLAENVLRGETLVYHPIGRPDPDNVAVGAISVQRPYDRPSSVEVFISLLNFNRTPVSVDIQLSRDGAALGIQETELSAAEFDEATGNLQPARRNVVFTPFEETQGAVIEVALLRDDNLSADNIAQVVVPPPKKLVVALVAAKSFVLRTVLEGMPQIRKLDLLSEAQFESLSAEARAEYDVIVLDNYAPNELGNGRYLTFGATPPVLGLNEYATEDGMIILDVKQESPIMRHVALDNIVARNVHLLSPAEDVQTIAEGAKGPAIITLTRGSLRLVHVTFDPLESNWPFQRSFVTFVVNAVEDLGQTGEALTGRGFSPGEALVARLPANASNISLAKPGGTKDTLTPLDPEALSWGPIRLAGLYQLSYNVPGDENVQSRAFAVNMDPNAEGDIAALEQVTIGSETIEGVAPGATQYTPLWPYALSICLGLLMIEWWVYHRKTFI